MRAIANSSSTLGSYSVVEALTINDSGINFPTSTMFKSFILTVAIGLSFTSSVFAQNADRFMPLGRDNDGMPMFLDLSSIRGVRFKLVEQMHPDEIAEVTMRVACAEGKVTMVSVVLYDKFGSVLNSSHEEEVLPVSPNSPVANARSYVCS